MAVPIHLHREIYNETLHILSAVNRTIYKARNEELKPLGISSQQSALLHQIKSLGDKSTVTNISKRLHRDISSVSDMLVRLEERGLVRRFISPMDRRQVYIFLTNKGQELRDESPKETNLIRRVRSQMSEEKIRDLNSSLKELYRICLQEDEKVTPSKK